MFGPSILVCPVYKCTRESVGMVNDFSDQDGKTSGVTAIYIKSGEQQVTVRKELKPGLEFTEGAVGDQEGQSSIRFEGTYTPKIDGSLAFQVDEPHAAGYPVKCSIEGQPIPSNPLNGDWQFPLFSFQARAGVPVHFSLETKMGDPAFQVVRVSPKPQQRSVYLPVQGGWYDFWTGDRMAGSKTINVETPLNMIPLYVRAGAIIPMGPEVQYATEQPDAPIEFRIYRGANGAYTLYQDEDDNYDYEKGAYAQIPITWNEAQQQLTFGARKGSFPGMPTNCTFNVVWVSSGHGGGEAVAATPDDVVSYEGDKISIQAPKNSGP
jgi:hypothetical protein